VIRALYRGLTDLATVPLALWLDHRARRGKEDPARLDERRGITAIPRPAGRVVWLHAASMGESLSILPLLQAITTRGWSAVVTTGTVTSAQMLAERLPDKAIHQYVPLDRTAWANNFLQHWKPDLVIWTESELWPNTLAAVAARKIPAALVNARLSDRAFTGWKRWPDFARETVAAFTMVLAQSDADRSRFAALGARDTRVAGNLKLAAPDLPYDSAQLSALTAAIGDRPRWLAASIHPGEDTIAFDVHARLKSKHPGLITLVVPRHDVRGAEMASTATARGLTVVRRSQGLLPEAATDIYLADTMGELGLFYRLNDLVFLGKSLAVGGGQNPAEAAQLGCALLLGPDMSNFRDMTAALITAGAAQTVTDTAALTEAVDRFLTNPHERNRRGAAAKAYMAAQARALEETLSHLTPLLD